MIQRRETSSSFEKKKYIPTVGKKIMHVNVYNNNICYILVQGEGAHLVVLFSSDYQGTCTSEIRNT